MIKINSAPVSPDVRGLDRVCDSAPRKRGASPRWRKSEIPVREPADRRRIVTRKPKHCPSVVTGRPIVAYWLAASESKRVRRLPGVSYEADHFCCSPTTSSSGTPTEKCAWTIRHTASSFRTTAVTRQSKLDPSGKPNLGSSTTQASEPSS